MELISINFDFHYRTFYQQIQLNKQPEFLIIFLALSKIVVLYGIIDFTL